jgi:hypothetical protein
MIHIDNIGGAIQHWFAFQIKIGRKEILNESSLKYPLLDYLVNEGNTDIKKIKPEYPHPKFPSRHIDLAICDYSTNSLESLFEFKIVSTTTKNSIGKKLIFNDLIRLHLAKLSTLIKCYFIICGESADFKYFQNIIKDNKTPIKDDFYRKWFSFVKNENKTFNVKNETEPTYKEIYDAFIKDYYSKDAKNLELPEQITTKCEFITPFTAGYVPYICGIWSVS